MSIRDHNKEAQEITNNDFDSKETLNIPFQPVIKCLKNKISTSTQTTTNKRNAAMDTQINDEYDLYGQEIALKLKKLDPLTRAQAQHRINIVLYDTELKILGRNLEFPSYIDSSRTSTPYSVASPSSFNNQQSCMTINQVQVDPRLSQKPSEN